MNIDWQLISGTFFPGHNLNDLWLSAISIWQVAFIALPISLLMYVMTHKYNHYILVETGNHRWLIK